LGLVMMAILSGRFSVITLLSPLIDRSVHFYPQQGILMSPVFPRTHGRFRRRTRRPISSVITLLTAAALGVGRLTACSNAGGSEEKPAALTYLDPHPFSNLYPPTAGFYPNGGVVNTITDRLLWQDPDTLELHPWIAIDLPEVNEDATEFTFHLRDGVTYSDGTPLDAENVVKNFDLFGLGNTDNKLTASEHISSYERGEVIDDSTVRF